MLTPLQKAERRCGDGEATGASSGRYLDGISENMIQIKKKKNVTEINSLISVQLKSEDRLIESRLFTLQLKA